MSEENVQLHKLAVLQSIHWPKGCMSRASKVAIVSFAFEHNGINFGRVYFQQVRTSCGYTGWLESYTLLFHMFGIFKGHFGSDKDIKSLHGVRFSNTILSLACSDKLNCPLLAKFSCRTVKYGSVSKVKDRNTDSQQLSLQSFCSGELQVVGTGQFSRRVNP